MTTYSEFYGLGLNEITIKSGSFLPRKQLLILSWIGITVKNIVKTVCVSIIKNKKSSIYFKKKVISNV